jgi:ergothioneine biosynthesis protein EgtB
MSTPTSGNNLVDRQSAIDAYRDNRNRSQTLFGLLDEQTYYQRPIPLRHPVVFYEGHIPAFSVNCFLKKGLGHAGIDRELEVLFARGIDPSDQIAAGRSAIDRWPERPVVQTYARDVDDAILDALEHADIEDDANPVLYRGQGVFTVLEHEVMHQETLLYMWHRFEPARKTKPAGASSAVEGVVPERRMIRVPAGQATLGAKVAEVPFGWDNEFPEKHVDVPAFDVDAHDVTNQDYLTFVEAGGYRHQDVWSPRGWQRQIEAGRDHPLFWERCEGTWLWRGMFESLALPMSWPVYVTHDEAVAYATWRGLRLLTESEFHRAAYGTPDGTERAHPWGDQAPSGIHGNFDFQHWDPVPVGSYPEGRSAWGVHDIVGNGWEWTSTVFKGFSGFRPMASYPEYSADFFDGDHYVVKGASPATGRRLVRRSFRNWFRPNYPYMYATFRCARDAR